jgi:hypothetical protein
METYQGVPVWHASAALQPLKPVAFWSIKEEQIVRRVLCRLLRGVGLAPDLEDDRLGIAIHLRRKVTPAEHRIVGPAMDVRLSPPAICACDACRLVST